MKKANDTWNNGDPYEYFMGRWSRLVAPAFLHWLNMPANLSWLDLGCGTGALSEAIHQVAAPAGISATDPSPGFISIAKKQLPAQVDVTLGSAADIPYADHSFDVVVSGLAFNFFPDPGNALAEIKRVLRKNAVMGAYVWDYAGRMDFLRYFWDAAIEVNREAKEYDEGMRFPVCNAAKLREVFTNAGFENIETADVDVLTVFTNFEDYWKPFLGGQGPAPTYLSSLNEKYQNEIKNMLLNKLPIEPDGSIRLLARAIAVRGVND